MFPKASRAIAGALLLSLIAFAAAPLRALTLYDGAAGTAPSSQGWSYLWEPILSPPPSWTVVADRTLLDTTPKRGDQAGWFGFGLVELDRFAGYSLRFDLRVEKEGHGNDSRAGLSVIALSSDSVGLEIGFWEDSVWVQDDDPLFVRAETAPLNTRDSLLAYHLNVDGDDYRLVVDGQVLLEGKLRDYSGFGPPYSLSDFLFVGDDTSSAEALFELGRVEASPLFRIATATLPAATLGTAYSQQLVAENGVQPLDWELVDGRLPAGLELDPVTGQLLGVPTEAGRFAATIAVTDFAGNLAEATLELTAGPLSSTFVHKPYLQRPRTDGVDILWWAGGPDTALLRYGESGLDELVVSEPELIELTDPEQGGTALRWRHFVQLHGLPGDRQFDYQVQQGVETFDASFRTAPERKLTPIRFLVWADTETERASVGKLGTGAPSGYAMDQDQGIRAGVRAAMASGVDFLLHAGDLVQEGGELSDWDELFDRLNDPLDGPLAAHVPMIAVPGNHDYWGEGFSQPGSEDHAMQKFRSHLSNWSNTTPTHVVDPAWPSELDAGLRAAQDGRYFAFRYGPATFIGLDTNDQGPDEGPDDTNWYLLGESDPGGGAAPGWMPGSRQYQWLEERLQQAQSETPFIFVFWHQAPWSEGPHNQVPPDDYQIGTPTRALDALLHRYRVTAVFNGHEEMIEHSETRGDEAQGGDPQHVIRYFTPGTVGDGIRDRTAGVVNPNQVFHYADSVIGRHYGYLQVEIGPGTGDTWIASFRQAWIDPAAAGNPLVDPRGGFYDEENSNAYFAVTIDLPDGDGDGAPDDYDVCPLIADPGQADLDQDYVGDACDAVQSGCSPRPLVIEEFNFAPGAHALGSAQGITTLGNVVVEPSASLVLDAPVMRFGAGFRVATGGTLSARAGAVSCSVPPSE